VLARVTALGAQVQQLLRRSTLTVSIKSVPTVFKLDANTVTTGNSVGFPCWLYGFKE
jgi:hypothetical protein